MGFGVSITRIALISSIMVLLWGFGTNKTVVSIDFVIKIQKQNTSHAVTEMSWL